MKTVFALFDRFDQARQAQMDFARAGLAADHVGLLSRQPNSEGLTRIDVPGIGALAVNGAMRRMLDTGGARDRDLGDTLMRLGIPRDDIGRCTDALSRGAILEAVVVDDSNEPVARAVFDRHFRPGADLDDIVVPVIREELEVGTREVDAGGVRITSRVREVPVEQTITIREERVTVERRVIDRPLEEYDDAFRDRVYDLRARAEEPVVRKRAHVVEEIRVHKDKNERRQSITDSLRHTDVKVADLPGERAFDASRYREHFEKFYGGKTELKMMAPAYEFGERLSRTTRGDFEAIEADARGVWERTNPNSWDKSKDAIRAGWQRIRNN